MVTSHICLNTEIYEHFAAVWFLADEGGHFRNAVPVWRGLVIRRETPKRPGRRVNCASDRELVPAVVHR